VAIASYAAASLAGSDLWRTGLAGMRLAVAAYLLPFAFVLQPALVLQGSALDAAVAIAGALVAGWLLAQALSGGSALRVAVLAAAALAVGAVGTLGAAVHPSVVALFAAAALLPRLFAPPRASRPGLRPERRSPTGGDP
jgi:TRAP-type uncharacterized transport system fused permease subunit